MRKKIIFTHEHGTVEGIYMNAGAGSPLIIIVNGHNGFYNYGMFPHIQQAFFNSGISSYSFNFSHGGVIGDSDYFEDLEKYERNCMRLETEDMLCVLQNFKSPGLNNHSKIILFAHSLGGIPAIFGTKKAFEQNINADGIILVSTVKTLNFWPPNMIKEWAHAGVYYKINNRTKQQLPQGFEFLQEILECEKDWNVEQIIKQLPLPILIIHGENDEAIPVEHAHSLFSWIKDSNKSAALKIIKNASHTFNTKHPFDKSSVELEELIQTSISWINKISN
jgi:uncharacterized protein